MRWIYLPSTAECTYHLDIPVIRVYGSTINVLELPKIVYVIVNGVSPIVHKYTSVPKVKRMHVQI